MTTGSPNCEHKTPYQVVVQLQNIHHTSPVLETKLIQAYSPARYKPSLVHLSSNIVENIEIKKVPNSINRIYQIWIDDFIALN